MLKELVTPQNANVFVGKLGDILYKAVDKPLGMAIDWGRMWSLWPVHIETACCSVEFGAASGPRWHHVLDWCMIKCQNQNMLLQWVHVQ